MSEDMTTGDQFKSLLTSAVGGKEISSYVILTVHNDGTFSEVKVGKPFEINGILDFTKRKQWMEMHQAFRIETEEEKK